MSNTKWIHNAENSYHELHFDNEVVAIITFDECENEYRMENNITGYSESYLADEEDLDAVMAYARESVIEYYDDMIEYYTDCKNQFENEEEE